MAELKELVFKRDQLKAQLSRFEAFVASFDDKKYMQLQTRLERIEAIFSEFNDIQSQIEFVSEMERNAGEREGFENIYFEVVPAARELIIKNEQEKQKLASVSSDMDRSMGLMNISSVKLPTLNLPTFYGDYDKWLQFADSFRVSVHDNKYLDDMQKFQYLLNCVKGDAHNVIQSMEISKESYQVAWKLLEERYENKPVIIQSHLKSLLDMPTLSRESSHYLLRKLIDNLQKHLRSLKSLGEPVDRWDRILIFLMARKLDYLTKKEWEEVAISTYAGNPKTEDFIKFLVNRCQVLETIDNSSKLSKVGGRRGTNEKAAYVATQSLKCEVCKGSHYIYHCQKLLSLQGSSRLAEIKKLRLCLNCLRTNHFVQDCKSEGCKACGLKHNTLLHFETKEKTANLSKHGEVEEKSGKVEASTSTAVAVVECAKDAQGTFINAHCIQSKKEIQIILSTAVVYIADVYGNWHKCRALLDSGSQSNFMTRELQEKLKLSTSKIRIPILGVNQTLTNINFKAETFIKSVQNDYRAELSFLILNTITGNIPGDSFDSTLITIPENLILADPNFNVSGKIDILLGAGIFFDLMCVGQIKTGSGQPVLQKTLLGWIVSGPRTSVYSRRDKGMQSNLSVEQGICEQLEKFWRLEECSTKKEYSQDELQCEQSFVRNFYRDKSGRFVVTLPIREHAGKLGGSREAAIKRFYALEKRLLNNPEIRDQYKKFMWEYEALGHMSKIDLTGDENENIYYLPHHGVVNEASLTTKLRVVFDASAKTTTGVSLNDMLQVGPSIQDDLFSVLLRFRKHRVAITGDIEKMYRQVMVEENQRDLQRIIWRADPSETLGCYRLNTITYGTAPASFLAVRCLQQTAIEARDTLTQASRVILSDFYMDDLLSGADTVENAMRIKQEVSGILSKSGFNLRKWLSNKAEIIAMEDESEDTQYYITNEGESRKTLGLLWNTKLDIFEYQVQVDSSKSRSVTKRFILSTIARIFDPLGWIGPVAILAKMILQRLWSLKLEWDEAVPIDLFTIWVEFYNQLPCLNSIKIPRLIIIESEVTRTEIHGFCDASVKGYGACLYLRTRGAEDIKVKLLCAKSKVAPLKTVSLPRLELCGAVLLARLVHKVREALDMPVDSIHLWCDSTIVLAWLGRQGNTWKTFVANRVTEIQRLTEVNQWQHVASKQNPADIISRGVNPNQLVNLSLWWSGPEWLLQNSEMWPKSGNLNVLDIPEKRNINLITISEIPDDSIFTKFSSLYKLERIAVLCLRFYKNITTHKTNKITGKITIAELKEVRTVLIKVMQGQEFKKEIHALKGSKMIPRDSKLSSLDPFLDKDQIIRVGGRLSNSQLNYDQKYPIVLPQKHTLTKLIILQEHHRQLHAGAQTILACLRQRYWPLNARSTVRGVLRGCVTCFRVKPMTLNRKMGNRPAARVTPNRPFSICGVDFAGPFNLKDGKLRNRAIIKAYLCIFICFSTKAVHLELVGNLTTASFLNCFKRFVSRRGLCAHVYSDNGTNFVGANNELVQVRELLSKLADNSELTRFCEQNEITWHFIPPRSPHQGGLWEAAVKAAKFHITRIVRNVNLTFEEMTTVFAQTEAVLNSRPITPLSNDPNDLLALTPGHFLIGDSLTAVPQEDVKDVPSNRLSRYKQLQQIVQHFWDRWSKDYLSTLQQRSKWKNSVVDSLKVGSMVVLKDDKVAPLNWRLGRVVQLHPGGDNVTRVVSVKTPSGVFTRAVQKVCLLPID